MRGVSAVATLLKQTKAPLRIFVVWEPILPTDWLRPTGTVLSRISDARALQYWDKGHLIAKEIRQEISGLHGPSCCEADGTLWDVILLYPSNTRWGESPPSFIDGPVVRAVPELRKKLTSSMDMSKVGVLRDFAPATQKR